jgi:single-stranded-DNA-specific exonuclease
VESLPHLSASWEVYPLLSKAQFQAAEEAGIDRLHAQLLFNRGIKTIAEMKRFIEADYDATPDPLALIDMPRAVERIQQALERGEHITVYGDYDADGVTSCALLFRALQRLKQPTATLDYYIPHRLRDGCGLHIPALDLLKARGTTLIITTDCASSDIEQAAYARELGIDIIVTDHHHPPDILPDVYAMVNPWRPDCAYGERYLCGVGIAFKLAQALYRRYRRSKEEEKDLLDLVAVGTIADIAPLLGENHTLVRLGMQHLNNTPKAGLKALIQKAGLQPGKIRERDIAYGLAPRINAAGRMKDAGLAFQLLTTDSEEEAASYAEELDQLNRSRQQETEELMRNVREQAQSQPTQPIVLVSGDDWHEGIIGLIAGKLAEEIKKPVLVLSNDRATKLSRGSARSQQDFNIVAALRGFSDRLERYGGHAQAAGFTIRSERVEELREHLLAWNESGGASVPAVIEGTELPDQTGVVTEQETTEVTEAAAPAPRKMVDLVFTRLEKLDYALYTQLRRLSPFGAGNPEPVFMMEKVPLLDKRASGFNKQNLQLRLGKGKALQRGTFSRAAALEPALNGITHINVIFRLASSEDETKPEVWLQILDIEPAE